MVESAAGERRQSRESWRTLARIVGKALLLFLLLNIGFALLRPLEGLGQLSTYNLLFPGRQRLPYGDKRSAEYNLSLNNIPAMMQSHTIAGASRQQGYRVLVIGDSSVWGWLLEPEETLAAQLNEIARQDTGRPVHFYNLGYPVLSAAKDLLLLQEALAYEPDLIIWPVTLASLAPQKQLEHPLLQENAGRVRSLIAAYDLAQDPDDPRLHDPTFWEQTIAGRRRDLADLLRLQLLAPLWAATAIDQQWPQEVSLRQSDFEADPSWEDYSQPVDLTAGDLAFDVLQAGVEMAGEVPLLIVNEPIYISTGDNSDLRYNSFYPRWAYDQYRRLLADTAANNGWRYLDLWDTIPAPEFTDTPVHLTPAGTRQLASQIWQALATKNLLAE